MVKSVNIDELLKKYRFNTARVQFLEGQLKRLSPETYDDFIQAKMFTPGYSGYDVVFAMEGQEEIALLNKVEETSQKYRIKCEQEYRDSSESIQKEINELKHDIAVIEDAIDVLGRINEKYKLILEKYYLKNMRMEDIAYSIHMSRSRCYDLCKKGLEWMEKVIYGGASL